MKDIIDRLQNNNIHISLVENELKVKFNGEKLNDDLIKELKENKESIIKYLKSLHIDTKHIAINPTEKLTDYPLSSSQKRLWILCQFDEANIAYNMPEAYVFSGDLNILALKRALKTLVDRHEIFRTCFKENEWGEVRQFIIPSEDAEIELFFEDIRSSNSEVVRNLIQKERETCFDLAAGPLLKAKLLHVSENQFVFSSVMHHIISDGWSMEVMIRELLILYNSYSNGNDNPLLPLRIQYKDYSAWQQKQLVSNELNVHKEYWLNKFNDALPLLELPQDYVHPAIKTYNGKIINKVFSTEITTGLRKLCQSQGATLFMGLLAGVKALLYRYTDQRDIIIGSPIAGRVHSDLENQIGFYVNTLALRTQFKPEDHFVDLINNIKNVTLEAFEHQLYPFDELVSEVYDSADLSRNPLFDVVVVLQNTELDRNSNENLGDVAVCLFEETKRTVSLFDLRFDFKEIGDELYSVIEYNIDLFESETVERMSVHLENLLFEVVNNPVIPLQDIDYITYTEKQQLLFDFNNSTALYPHDATLVTLFEEQVANYPNHIALVYEDLEVTYDQLNKKANKIAHFLLNEIHLTSEETVGILIDRKIESITSILGILKAGGTYVPFDTNLPEDRLKFMINDTKTRIVVTEKKFLELINRLQWSCSTFENYVCVNSIDVYTEKEVDDNVMMSQELWDHVGQIAIDTITGGGWSSSYTGLAIPAIEMEEYAMNVYKKLESSLTKEMRVLEIGCSSGLTLSKIAPNVSFFYGTDLSPVILENTKKMVDELGFTNVKLTNVVADNITSIDENDFDLIIINSVIQHFHGHNYLRKVINDAVGLLKNRGRIFIGDIMDIDMKEMLIADLEEFKLENKEKGYKTKTDFSSDLFVSRYFFEDLVSDQKGVVNVEISEKIRTIENELTKFRYDTILEIDKEKDLVSEKKHKNQFGSLLLDQQPDINLELKIAPKNSAYIIYTSGTTGKPKGVMVEHENVVRLFKTDQPLFDFRSSDVWTLFHSYSFDFSVWEIFGALLFGGKLVIVPKDVAQDAGSFLTLLEKEQVTVLNQTPSSFYAVSKAEMEKEISALNLRYVIFGGEALSPGKLKEWIDRYPQAELINMYGITETTVHVTHKKITAKEIDTNVSNIGRPIPTLQCYVLDSNQNLVPIGVSGELYVGGKGVSRGYLGNEQLTLERFISNPFLEGERLYRSGDRVRFMDNGEMEYQGRMDDQVKIRGHRIELGEIESKLQKNDAIEKALVLARRDSNDENNLVAYLISKESLNTTELCHYLKGFLPDYMIPSHFVQLDEFPLTANGKIDKKALPNPEGLGLSSGKEYVGPRNETEEKLVRIWEEILGQNRISIEDDFFELGGHSLKAMRVMSKINSTFGVRISINTLFNIKTIRGLSNEIETINWVNHSSAETTNVSDDIENFSI